MYNHAEKLKDAVAFRAVNNWPELERVVRAERISADGWISVRDALERHFARFQDPTPHPLEEGFRRMLAFQNVG